tara:strand:- start:2943 stop:3050 length:108 start_codon:yes stop_codon:yes gene_type:complete
MSEIKFIVYLYKRYKLPSNKIEDAVLKEMFESIDW